MNPAEAALVWYLDHFLLLLAIAALIDLVAWVIIAAVIIYKRKAHQ